MIDKSDAVNDESPKIAELILLIIAEMMLIQIAKMMLIVIAENMHF
jgi:hypothetical protein